MKRWALFFALVRSKTTRAQMGRPRVAMRAATRPVRRSSRSSRKQAMAMARPGRAGRM